MAESSPPPAKSNPTAYLMAEYFTYKLSISHSQKEFIGNLNASEDKKSILRNFFRKIRLESIPLPAVEWHGRVITLLGDHPVKIDFSQIEKKIITVNQIKVEITTDLSPEEVYKTLRKEKHSGSSPWMLFWVPTAWAEPLENNLATASAILSTPARWFNQVVNLPNTIEKNRMAGNTRLRLQGEIDRF